MGSVISSEFESSTTPYCCTVGVCVVVHLTFFNVCSRPLLTSFLNFTYKIFQRFSIRNRNKIKKYIVEEERRKPQEELRERKWNIIILLLLFRKLQFYVKLLYVKLQFSNLFSKTERNTSSVFVLFFTTTT